MHVPFFRLNVTDGMRRAVNEVVASGWLTSGPKVQAFESEFAEHVGARYAVGVNSCTAALHLALEAIGVGPGDRVLVPTMTFAATAEVVRYMGADPVFTDVCPHTALMTPEIVAEALERHTDVSACMPVHFGGLPCDMDGIRAACEPHGVRAIADAAHAFPASDQGRPVGSMADASCYSFYANKTLTTGEGGMLVTDDAALADRARVMRLHGMNRDAWGRFTVDTAKWEYDIIAPGYKYNMPDLAAAIGLAQLPHAESDLARRTDIARRYDSELKSVSQLRCCGTREGSKHAWHLFWIVLESKATLSRNDLLRALGDLGVACSVHYKPLHRMSYWQAHLNLDPSMFPGAESLWQGCLSLPVFPNLRPNEQDHVINSIRAALA